MRFLHLADLHLGKRFNDYSMIEDQKQVLNQALETAEDVDCVLICGDIYDKKEPSNEALKLFDWFITSLTALGKKVFIIYGNHDSPQRIAYFSSLLKSSGIYSSGIFDGKIEKVELNDEFGPLNIYLLPFFKPAEVRQYYPQETVVSYQDAVKTALKHAQIDTSQRNVLLVHQFITNSETCDSEEQAVGGLNNIDAEVFDDFDYVALGHIHKPQMISRETLRYSGSILKYSFSEELHRKSFCVFEMKEKGNIEINPVEIRLPHNVRTIKGMFSDMMQLDYSEDYIRVILNDEDPYPDARNVLITRFPNLMNLTIENSSTSYEYEFEEKDNFEESSIEDLFRVFYMAKNSNNEPDDATRKLFEEVLEEAGREVK